MFKYYYLFETIGFLTFFNKYFLPSVFSKESFSKPFVSQFANFYPICLMPLSHLPTKCRRFVKKIKFKIKISRWNNYCCKVFYTWYFWLHCDCWYVACSNPFETTNIRAINKIEVKEKIFWFSSFSLLAKYCEQYVFFLLVVQHILFSI